MHEIHDNNTYTWLEILVFKKITPKRGRGGGATNKLILHIENIFRGTQEMQM